MVAQIGGGKVPAAVICTMLVIRTYDYMVANSAQTLASPPATSQKSVDSPPFQPLNAEPCPVCTTCPVCATCPVCSSSKVKDEIEQGKSVNEQNYDADYWSEQQGANVFSGVYKGDILRHFFSKPSVESVLEFGSAGGYIVSKLPASVRAGVEVNQFARDHAKETNSAAQYYERLEDVDIPEGGFEIIYSTSVIEHVDCPLSMLRQMRTMLKPGGQLIIGIKNDGADPAQSRWKSGDLNHHIYTWNELLLGNMMQSAGLHICGVQGYYTAWHGNFMRDYTANKKGWCQAGLNVGKSQNVYYIWAIGTLDATFCGNAVKALTDVASCNYFE